MAWQGQFSGNEGYPPIVLEALVDNNLFIWHGCFGWAGTCNNLNIWGGSNLQKQFLDGSWSADDDFNFNIGEYSFSQLWILVDGIYPEISRFVKTHLASLTRDAHIFAKWQEATQKDKLNVLLVYCSASLSFFTESGAVVHYRNSSCIMFHNWMVTICIERDKIESKEWYNASNEHDDVDDTFVDIEADAIQQCHVNQQQHSTIFNAFYKGNAVNFSGDVEICYLTLPTHWCKNVGRNCMMLSSTTDLVKQL
jgi:Plant transposon protein